MSENAYNWAKEHPQVIYNQGKLQEPAIETGAYGDRSVEDELQWAATELFITTGKEKYYTDARIEKALGESFDVPSWPKVNTLALYSLARNKKNLKIVKLLILKLSPGS